MQTRQTACCIVGGGPAGMVLGYLLARKGVYVTVLEKHKDFFRDFRGDTVHPSTLEVFYELGLLDELLAIPHQEVRQIGVAIGGAGLRYRRHHASADALEVCGADAAVGPAELFGEQGGAVSKLHSADGA